MPAQISDQGRLAALSAVLASVESVRNLRALYLLLLTFSGAGLLISAAQRDLAGSTPSSAAWWAGAAFLCVFYGTNAAGLVVLDEARGIEPRPPGQALRDALGSAHRLLAVVGVVLLAALVPVAAVTAMLAAARLPAVGSMAMVLAVALGVPALGLTGLAMLSLVGPIAAPAVWAGRPVRQVLGLIARHLRRRPAHVVLLSAAVSLLTAAVAGLASFVVLLGGQTLLALAVSGVALDLAPRPILAALFGTGFRLGPGSEAWSPLTSSAITGAGTVFAFGLVVPGVVYLRGACELYLALDALDGPADPPRSALAAGRACEAEPVKPSI